MRRFQSAHRAQRFLITHAAAYNLFNLGRHLILANHYLIFPTTDSCVLEKRSGFVERRSAGLLSDVRVSLSVSSKPVVKRGENQGEE